MRVYKSACCVILVALLTVTCTNGEDPYRFYNWNVTYGDIYPLGIKQQVFRSSSSRGEVTVATDPKPTLLSTMQFTRSSVSASTLRLESIYWAFFKPISNVVAPSFTKRHAKIFVIGAGNVGMAITHTWISLEQWWKLTQLFWS
ncbi:hypothetical protein ACFX2C_015643 [Malus domestica]